MAKLTPKQDAFVKAYLLNGGNATQAAIDAGYSESTSKEMGYENLTKPHIKKLIEKHQQEANNVFIWSKEKKLLLLEKIAECATKTDPEKGMINMQSAIAAMKEHNLMQGDNAPTETSNVHKVEAIDDFNDC
jgi:phage terminase small subunit